MFSAFTLDATALESAITTFFSGIGDQIGAILIAVIPIGLTIFGAFLGIRYGKQFFKTVSKG